MCHLLTNIGLYCKEVLSGHASYEAELDDSAHDLEATRDYENMDLENFVYERVTEEIEAKRRAEEKIPFHLHAPRTLVGLVEGRLKDNIISLQLMRDYQFMFQ